MKIVDYYQANLKYLTFKTEKSILNKYRALPNSKSLDLGCGKFPEDIFNTKNAFGIDIVESKNKKIIKCDLSRENIPFENEYFEYVTGRDLIEHIPRQIYVDGKIKLSFIDLMNEIYRVLKKDGIFYSNTPFYPNSSSFVDPTHVNHITTETFNKYFCSPLLYAKRYGFVGKFKLEKQFYKNQNLITILKKI